MCIFCLFVCPLYLHLKSVLWISHFLIYLTTCDLPIVEWFPTFFVFLFCIVIYIYIKRSAMLRFWQNRILWDIYSTSFSRRTFYIYIYISLFHCVFAWLWLPNNVVLMTLWFHSLIPFISSRIVPRHINFKFFSNLYYWTSPYGGSCVDKSFLSVLVCVCVCFHKPVFLTIIFFINSMWELFFKLELTNNWPKKY